MRLRRPSIKSKRGQQAMYRGERWIRFTNPYQSLPPYPACYVVYDASGFLLYVGQTVDLRKRFYSHKVNGSFPPGITVKIRCGERFGDWAMREARLIHKLRPPMNMRVQ